MKTVIKMLSIVALLVTAISCAPTTASIGLPDKYNLDDNLKAVNRISGIGASSWRQADDQSVMITANGRYYLLVLNKPLEAMDDKIGFRGDLTNIRAGYSGIYVGVSSDRRYYDIEKIYELEGVDQAKEIKKQLGKN